MSVSASGHSPAWRRHTVRGCWQGLDCTLELPARWTVEQPPDEAIDFDLEPARLQPLLRAHAGDADLQLQLSARPATTVSPLVVSATYLMGEIGLLPDVDGDDRPVGPHAALSGPARLEAGGPARAAWYAYFEDGGRLLQLCLHGPPAAASTLATVWTQLLATFRLLHAQGALGSMTDWQRAPPAAGSGPPAWWLQAEALQGSGQLDEALALVGQSCSHQGAVLSQAELCAREMRRLLAAGDRPGAVAAHERACRLAWAYAAQATSGGEGTALSHERDRFLAALGPVPDGDG